MQLPFCERIQLVEDPSDTIAEDSDANGLTPVHIAKLDRRRGALKALPEAGMPWNIAHERILPSH